MDNYNDLLGSVKETIEGLQQLRNIAYQQYSELVTAVLNGHITEEQQLEGIMDGLSDFCDEERFIELYRSLCRHIYYRHPQLVGEHVSMFRALFETSDSDEQSRLSDCNSCKMEI